MQNISDLNTIVRAIALCSSIVLFSYSLSLVLNKSFGKCIPLSFIVLYFIQYGAHLTGKLSNNKYLLTVFVLLSILIIVKRGNVKELVKKRTLWLFVLFFIYFYAISCTKYFSCIDDFWNWGIRVKECLRINALYSVSSNTVVPPDTYHPFLTIIEIFFCKILGGYSEQACIFSIMLFSTSFIFAFIDDNSKIINIVLLVIFGLITLLTISLSSMLCESFLLNSLYVDWPLSIVFSYSLFCVYEFDFNVNSYIYISLLLSIMLLIKQIALFLFMSILLYLIIIHFVDNKNKKYLFFMVIPIFVFLLWRINVSTFISNSNLTAITSKSFSDVFSSIKNGVSIEYWHTIWSNFINKCLYEGIVGNTIKISYIPFIIFIVVVYIIYAKFLSDKKMFILSIFYFIFSFIYLFVIYFSYCTIFIEHEALTLAEYARYMQLFTFSGLFLLFCLISKNKNIKEIVFATLVMCFFIEPLSIKTIFPNKDSIRYNGVDQKIVNEYVSDVIGNEQVLCVAQNDHTEYCFVRYLFGEKMNNVEWHKNENINDSISIYEYLKKYKYIYIGIYDEDFKNNFWDTLTDVDLYNESLYSIKINEENGVTIMLERIFTE